MKTIEELKAQTPVFLHNWSEAIDVIGDFEDLCMTGVEYRATEAPYENEAMWLEKKQQMEAALKNHAAENILFASYGTDNYSGDAFVLFEQDGRLYEVNGSHCSCVGLEGQWSPEETTLEALAHRLTVGTMGVDDYSGNEFATELKQFLGL
jgi:hypothetical protein